MRVGGATAAAATRHAPLTSKFALLCASISLARSSPRRAGTIWVPLGFNDPTNSSYYPVLLEIDATKTPATMTQHWLDESKAKGGIWSLFWTPDA